MKAEQLNANLHSRTFQVIGSEDQEGIFLCRRRALKDFLASEEQASAILQFFEESHAVVKDAVPWARNRHRELLNIVQPGGEV